MLHLQRFIASTVVIVCSGSSINEARALSFKNTQPAALHRFKPAFPFV
jgi:hypothetical protein